MEPLMETIVDFMRERQLNIAVACVLSCLYLVYQYWGAYFKGDELDEDLLCRRSRSVSRSRSRTRAGHYDYRPEGKHGRRRRGQRRCPDCSLCNYDQ